MSAIPAMRAEAYGMLADVLSYPDAELWQGLLEGTVQSDLCYALAAANPGNAPSLGNVTEDMAFAAEASLPELESAYLNAFELDAPSSPCPLYEGAHIRDTDRALILLEVKAFYQNFGLAMSGELNAPEDHLSAELEFMAFLATKQAAAEEEGKDAGAYLRAQRDFLARHLGRWVPLLANAAEQKVTSPFYRAMCRMLGIFVVADAGMIASSMAEV